MYLGRFREAREAAVECRRVGPTRAACVFELSRVLDDQGQCDELETALRDWEIASPDEPRAPHKLAELLLATDRPEAAVHELLDEARARLPAPARAGSEQQDAELLAWHDGDFALLEKTLRARDLGDGHWARQLIDIYLETGRDADALAVAEEFERKNANMPPAPGTSDGPLFNDPTSDMLAMLARGGAIGADEYHRRRDAWVHELDTHIGGDYRRQIWAHAYAQPARTADEAREAVAAMPRYEPLPPFYWFFVYGDIGRALVLGGKPELALPYLERATHRCLARDPRDFYYLGMAEQATGDRDGACAAYATAAHRWEHATPRSLTVERARAALEALGCPR
ncbi:MAG: tetratricopeptide repeat protein, partial [Acidobacteriota bacterium]